MNSRPSSIGLAWCSIFRLVRWPVWGRRAPTSLSGRTADARDAYQSFFKLWSDADPDIPVLRQAHAEFDRLKPAA